MSKLDPLFFMQNETLGYQQEGQVGLGFILQTRNNPQVIILQEFILINHLNIYIARIYYPVLVNQELAGV